MILSQGDESDSVYLVITGIVKSYILEANGKEFVIGFSGRGEILGEVEIFLRKPYLGSVEALRETEVFYIRRQAFLRWIASDAELNALILEELAYRLHTTTRRTSFQLLYPIEYSVLKILYLSKVNELSLTKTDVANYLGVTIRSLNRTIRTLQSKGILRFSGKHIVVQSEERLEDELIRYEE